MPGSSSFLPSSGPFLANVELTFLHLQPEPTSLRPAMLTLLRTRTFSSPFPSQTSPCSPFPRPRNSAAVPDLPAFCRFGAWIHTSNVTKVQFEVWLPTADAWSGRFAHVGNGVRFFLRSFPPVLPLTLSRKLQGDTGRVNFPDMAISLTKCTFRSSFLPSTRFLTFPLPQTTSPSPRPTRDITERLRTGTLRSLCYEYECESLLTSSSPAFFLLLFSFSFRTFAAGNPESQIDFGHRAVHLSTVYSKAIVEVRLFFLFPSSPPFLLPAPFSRLVSSPPPAITDVSATHRLTTATPRRSRTGSDAPREESKA